MKTFLAIVLTAAYVTVAQTSQQAPPQPQKTQTPPELSGKVTYEQLRTTTDSPDHLYHIGGDVCTEGSEHYAPECAPDPDVPSEVVKATLRLADGRIISISRTKVAAAARGEAVMLKDHKGSWTVTYRVIGQHDVEYPFAQIKRHHIEDIEVRFPATIGGRIHYVVNVITVDDSDPFLHAVDYAR